MAARGAESPRREPRQRNNALGLTHHNASAQVFEVPGGGTRFVWIADILPHKAALPVGQMMDRGIEVLKHTLESRPDARAGA